MVAGRTMYMIGPVADIGMKLFHQEPVAKELRLDEAQYIKAIIAQLSRMRYHITYMRDQA